METLYDLLGARPADDAEGLRNAFRRAAKANRAGLLAGNPDAPKRFRQLVKAYDILRDAEHRATYDRLLKFEHGRLYSNVKRAVSCLAHHIVSDAIGVIGLVVVLAGSHTLSAHLSKPPVNAIEAAARGPAEVAPVEVAEVHPAVRAGATEPDAPDGKRVAALDTPNAVSGANVTAANGGGAPIAPDQAQPCDVPFSSQKKDDGVATSSPSDHAKSDDQHETKIPDTRAISTHDLKMPETKITEKHPVEAKRRARSRTPLQQALLESRGTCSGPHACSRNGPPLFGIGN
jgi:hypothetical protein